MSVVPLAVLNSILRPARESSGSSDNMLNQSLNANLCVCDAQKLNLRGWRPSLADQRLGRASAGAMMGRVDWSGRAGASASAMMGRVR